MKYLADFLTREGLNSISVILSLGIVIVLCIGWCIAQARRDNEELRRIQEEEAAQSMREEVARRRAAMWSVNGGRSQHNINGGKAP